jgi:putative transposase
MTKQTEDMSLLEKRLSLLVSARKHFVNLVTQTRLSVIKLYPANENLVNKIWRRCVIMYLIMYKYAHHNNQTMKEKIIFMLAFPLKNKLTTLIDKLNSLKVEDLNTAHIYLLQMLLQELISREKDYQPYWTPVYNVMSEKLLLPIKTDYQDLDSTLLISSFQKQEQKSQSLIMKKINLQNKNCQKTSYRLSTSIVVDKWVKEATKVKTMKKSLKIKIKPTFYQKSIFNEWFNTSNYVYNKTIEYINKKNYKPNFINLRNILVTENTKLNNINYNEIIKYNNIIKELKKELKTLNEELNNDELNNDELNNKIISIEMQIKQNKKIIETIRKSINSEKNENIKDWELNTPKDIRAETVKDVCNAYKTAFTNLKRHNITHFNIDFRKKNDNKSIVIPKSLIKIEDDKIKIAPSYLKEECYFNIGNRTLKQHKLISINNDCRLYKQTDNTYYIIIPITIEVKDKKKPINYCGIDPGVRTFMTTFGNNGSYEYKHNKVLIDKLNKTICYLKSLRIKVCHNKRKAICKREIKKDNVINDLHWKTINHLLNVNDTIFYGNIKSHNIVKNGKNSILNQNFNDLKFYQFKQRLHYKANELNKLVYNVNEAYTSQYCSTCGEINKPKESKTYNCLKCKMTCDRDINASKNILLKGIIQNIL